MPLATDVEIAGAGYMVAPGSYKRTQDGMAEGRTGRVVVRDFFGGQRRAFQLERDRSWDAVGCGPAYFGQGVEPWGNESVYGDGSVTAPNLAARSPSLVVGDRVYVGIGQKLFRSPLLNAATWTGLSPVADLGAGVLITDLAHVEGNVVMACAGTADLKRYNTGTAAVDTPWAGAQGKHAIGYAGCLIHSGQTAATKNVLHCRGGSLAGNLVTLPLDTEIVRLALFRGKVAAATRSGLWLLGGRPVAAIADDAALAGDQSVPARWSAEPEPFFTSGVWVGESDFAFLLSHGGRLYTWLAGRVMEFQPAGQREGWREVGVEGKACYGAAVAGNVLYVALTTRTGDTETWACDGSGWWLFHRATEGASATRCWPVALAGAANRDLLLFRDGSTAYDLYRTVWRSDALHAYRGSASFRTSLLDAGDRDKAKAWRTVGATFAAPETRGNAASADQVVVALSCSIDGGATWTQAASATVGLAAGRVLELDADLDSNAVTSRWLQLKVDWSSVVDWAPVLTGVWAEYELLDAPARRRRWAFKVHAHDGTVERAGGAHPRTGRQLATDLWTAWQAGATLPFKDVDHDADPTVRQVRIVGIAEEIAKPADAGRWGESVVGLTLIEV